MLLGETIHRLRGERNLSQGDLAELLGVSRQSISRWETGCAVPELEKLVKLSEIFGVTLDELVRGETPPQEGPEEMPAPEAPPRRREPSFPARKIAGTVLLCMGFLTALLLTVLGSFLSGLLFASPFLLCGAVCFLFRRRVGLWCGWAVFFIVDFYLRYATGINWWQVRLTPIYEPSMNYMRLFTSWCQFLCLILFLVLTVFSFRRERIELPLRSRLLLNIGWIPLFLLLFVIPFPTHLFSLDFWFPYLLAQFAYDWGRVALLTVYLVLFYCSRRGDSAPSSF